MTHPTFIEPGDRVIDPLDGDVRTVDYISGYTAYMTDGGCMGTDEIDHVYLPGETIPPEPNSDNGD